MSDRPTDAIAVVTGIYAAIAASDIASLLPLIDEQCVITQDPALPWGGRHVGHEGFGHFAIALRSAVDSQVEVDAVFAADDDVFVCGRSRGSVVATGARFAIAIVHRWTVCNGRATAVHYAIDTPAMLDALAPVARTPTA